MSRPAHKAMLTVQSQLKAPKGQENKFGGYKYRSCEDILKAVKPLLLANEATLTISDCVVEVGGRVYVKANAELAVEGGSVAVEAFAREPEDRKGIDAAQITGATSSYARKYALNGLFAIDDTKDADYTNDHGKAQQKPATAKPASKPATPKPAAKPDPRVTVAKRIEADKDAKWFEVVPFKSPKQPCAGMTLGDIVAQGDPGPIKQVLDYIDPVALEHELAVKRLKAALAEIENPPKGSSKSEPETTKGPNGEDCPF